MCGIAGIHLKDPSAASLMQLERFVDAALLGIEPRGQDATGFVAVSNDGKVVCSKEATPAHRYIDERPELPEGVRTILMHTRFATQGAPEDNRNNHPVLYRTCFATHNGHISNDAALFASHELDRFAEVDSEAIPAMLSTYGLTTPELALEELEGGFAIAAIDPVNAPGKLLLAKGFSSPLIFFENNKYLVWASTEAALKYAWEKSLGTPPKTRKLKSADPGTFMLVEGKDVQTGSFTPKARPVVSTGWSSSPSGSYSFSSPGSNRYCECGHTAFWHKGRDLDGGCLMTVNKEEADKYGRKLCNCKAFADITASADEGLTRCDSCLDWYSEKIVEEVTSGWNICRGCLDWDKEDGTSSHPMSLPERSSDTCPIVSVTTVSEQLHEAVLATVAKDSGYPTEFVDWLLFTADWRIVDQLPFLNELQTMLDGEYASVEDELRDVIENAAAAEVEAA